MKRIGTGLGRSLRGLVLGWVVIALGVSGCSSGGSAPIAVDPPEKTRIKVGVLPIIDAAPLYLGIQRGLFATEGLTVEPVVINGGAEAIPKLERGQLDLSLGNYVSFLLAGAGGKPFTVAADGFQARKNAFLALRLPSCPITSVADLVGRKIAVNTRSNIIELMVRSVLRTNGVDPNSVKFVPIPFPKMVGALQRHEVDAAVFAEPFIAAAQQALGAQVLFDAASGATADMPIAGYAATRKWAQANPRTFAAFARAMVRAQHLAADRNNVETILPKYLKIDPKTLAVINIGTFPTSLNAVRLQRVADLMMEFNLVRTRPLAASLLE